MRLVTQNNGLQAYILLGKKDVGKNVDAAKIQEILKKSGVRFGISLEKWDALFNQFARGHLAQNSILVARGREPVPGEPGYIEYLVPTNRKFPVDDHDRDYLDQVLLRVKKGQPLFRVHPPGKGKPGMTVTGEPIPPEEGKPAELPKLLNVEQDANDENVYVAAIDGVMTYSDKFGVAVRPLEEIERSVSILHGLINVESSLLIHGDVKSGACIKADGDVFVLGTVEDAEIVAGGDVYVLKGFIGRGKGIIRAGNSVYVQHVNNQAVEAGLDIHIDEEAMKCKLQAGRDVIFWGKKSYLIGGYVSLFRHLKVYQAGNEKNIRTIIQIHDRDELIRELDTRQNQLEKVREELEKVKKYIYHIVKLSPKHQHSKMELLNDLVKSKERYLQTLEQLKREIPVLSRQLSEHRKGILVEVTGHMYPGVYIRFANRTFQVFRPSYNVKVTYADF